MKKWFWLGLLFAIAIIGTILFYGYIEHPTPTASQVTATNPPEISLSVPTSIEPLKKVNAPKVSNQKLLAHIQALNFERYEDSSRSKARDYIIQQLKALGWTPTLQTFEGGVNIVAERSGTEAQAGKILVAAHYDTVIGSPGADDNASGIATILEVARLLGKSRTPRTLQVAFFDLEERGLFGSLAFASKAENLQNLQGAIVLDMVGFACHTSGCQQYPQGLPITPPSDKGDFLAVAGDVEHMQLIDAFGDSSGNGLPPVVTLPIPFKGAATPDLLRSDHAPFWMRGIGAVLVTDTANFRTPHYHKPTDKPDTIDREFFVGAAQIVTNATATLLESVIAN